MNDNDYWHIGTQVYDPEAADKIEEAMDMNETEDWEAHGRDQGTCLTSRANLHRALDYVLDNGGAITIELGGATIELENDQH